MIALFVARQPIFDRDTRVAYYELSGPNNQDGTLNARLVTSVAELGMTDLPRGRPAIIQLQPQPHGVQLPPWPFIGSAPVGVSYPAPPGGASTGAGLAIPYGAEAAFVCLDTVNDNDLPLLSGRLEIVRLDARALGPDGVEEQVLRLNSQSVDIAVKNIANNDEFELYRALGAHYFQGSFLSAQRAVSTPSVAASQASALSLLAALQGDPDIHELRDIIAQDLTLSYKLLRYLNSAYFGLRRHFSSVRDAIVYLGREPLRRWVSLIIIANMASAPEELRRQALVRAGLCERLAEQAGDKVTAPYFTTGLFSLLDRLLGRPMDEVLTALPLHNELAAAIRCGEGRLGEALICAVDHERASWRSERYLELPADIITPIFAETTEWADGVMRLMS